MNSYLRVLMIDASSGFYKIKRYQLGNFFGPVDLGLHLAGRYNSLNFGTGLFSGSIFPGSNRMIFTGFSPAWGGFYISSMGGAGLVFDDLGINMVSIVGKAPRPSILYLNRVHGEEIQVEFQYLRRSQVWGQGRGGVYAMMDHSLELFGDRYENDPRILCVGPAAEFTDIGGIVSVPIKKGALSHVDTWAGRGGLGSKLFREHGIVSVIYGGTHLDEDFRDRKVADEWFLDRYQKKMAAKDFEATSKYRFDPGLDTGGTFGVNYAKMGGRVMAFNYKTIYMSEEERLRIHREFILAHYLKQFNEETIAHKQQSTCGEPCAAVCKKMNGQFKKDYEPYQTLGPLCGIFDQRAAERLNHHADSMGFDAISLGGVIAWVMDSLDSGLLTPQEAGVSARPVFSPDGFDVVADSARNADIAVEIIDAIMARKGLLDLGQGWRKLARKLAREKGGSIMDNTLYTAFGRKGWMVPNQYWTSGVLSPMAIMGKYYNHYSDNFLAPRELGRQNAKRLLGELIMDNTGICRFHRAWAEEMVPDIIEELYGLRDEFMVSVRRTAARINSRNSSVFWESERSMDFVHSFMKRRRDQEGDSSAELAHWISRFDLDKAAAALDFWYEIHKGIQESLREYY